MKKLLLISLLNSLVVCASFANESTPNTTENKVKASKSRSSKDSLKKGYKSLELTQSQLSAHYNLVEVKDPKVWYFFVKLFPSTPINKIYKTPYKDTYAVVAGKSTFYGQVGSPFVMVGHLFNPYTQQDQTGDLEQLQIQETRIDISTVDISNAVVTKGKYNPKGKKMVVIEDPDCPYCRVLEQQLVQNGLIDQIDIYRILIPLPMHKDAKQHITNVYCSEDNSMKVLDGYMIKGDDAQVVKLKEGCNAEGIMMSNGNISRNLNVNGTPTILLGNGKLVVGADIQAINDYINQSKDPSVKSLESAIIESTINYVNK